MNQQGACVAFGSFEFVHKGHLQIAKKVVELAKEKGMQSIIVSCPSEDEVYTTEKEKEYLLKQAGIDCFITYTAKDSLEVFLKYLKEELQVQVIVAGAQHPQRGEIQRLAVKMGLELELVSEVYYQERLIAKDWLAETFAANDFILLKELCGHPYILLGDVVHGKKLGRTVGMPTTNLHIYKKKKRPNCGVYATKIVLDGETYRAATNIGKRPTVDDFDYVTIESFILDFDKQIYGEDCVLEIHAFLREVKKFASLEEVRLQVEKDIEYCRNL